MVLTEGSELTQRARLRRLTAPFRRKIYSIAALSFVGGILEAAFLVVVTRLALAVANGKPETGILAGLRLSVGTAIAGAFGLLAARLVVSLVSVSVSTKLAADVGEGLRNEIARAYLDSSWDIMSAEPAGRLQQLVGANATASVALVTALTNSLSAAVNLIALLSVALAVDLLSTAAVVVALAGLGAALAPLRRRVRSRARDAQQTSMEVARSVSELGAMGLEMQIFGVRERFKEQIASLVSREASSRKDATRLQSLLPQVYVSAAFAALLVGLGLASLVAAGNLSAVGSVMLVMLRSLSYGQQLQTASGALMAGMPALEQIDTVMRQYDHGRLSDATAGIGDVDAIEFRDVEYRYTPETAALAAVCFRIERGEAIGVIGPSGSGKSTMAQILLGLREPTSGDVLVNGSNLATLDRNSWSIKTSFVPQDPSMFSGTLMENVRFFRDWISDEMVLQAIERASLTRFIDSLPDGVHTFLGERGARLSGGQRQRIAIARAIAGSPSLLVLDEPTSALDAENEVNVVEALRAAAGQATLVVIAHRISTLEICDRIVVIEDGRVSAVDTASALELASGYFRRAIGDPNLRERIRMGPFVDGRPESEGPDDRPSVA